MIVIPLSFLIAVQTKPKPLPAEAKRLIDECTRAFRDKDKAWFERKLSADFVYRDLKGETLNRADSLGRIGRWFRPLGYRVEIDLAPISARDSKGVLNLVGNLKVRSQLFGFRRMPLTETTVRVESIWRRKATGWQVGSIVELSSRKTVDGKLVED